MPRGGRRENAGRKSAWNNRETTVIRVPKIFAEKLLEIAQKLDKGETIEFVSKSKTRQIDEVTKLEKRNEIVTNSNNNQIELVTESNNGLMGTELAKRLGTSESSVRRHRDGKSLPPLDEWTRQKDPEGKAWEYRENGKYYQS